MGVERLDAPDRPALAIVVERLAGHGDRLGPVGRPRGHGEHQDLGARAEEGPDVALADPVDVGLVAVVAADRDPAAEVGRRPDLAEVVVAAELAVGVAGDPVRAAARAGPRAARPVWSRNARASRRARLATGTPTIRLRILSMASSIGREDGVQLVTEAVTPEMSFAGSSAKPRLVGELATARRCGLRARRLDRPARGVAAEEIDDPRRVGLGLALPAAVVLRLGDQPQLLRLAGVTRRGRGRSRGRCRRRARRGSSARGEGRAARRPSRRRGTGSSAAARDRRRLTQPRNA